MKNLLISVLLCVPLMAQAQKVNKDSTYKFGDCLYKQFGENIICYEQKSLYWKVIEIVKSEESIDFQFIPFTIDGNYLIVGIDVSPDGYEKYKIMVGDNGCKSENYVDEEDRPRN